MGSQTIQLNQMFAGSSGADLTTISGWTAKTGSMKLDGNGGIYCGTNGGTGATYINTTTMASNQQLVYGSFHVYSTNAPVYPSWQLRASNSNDDFYAFGLNGYVGSLAFTFQKYQSGSYNGDGVINNTQISNAGVIQNSGSDIRFIAIIQTTGSNVHFRLWVYTTQYGWNLVGNWTDTNPNANLLTNNAQVGVSSYSTIDTASVGVHPTSLKIYDYQVAFIAPNNSSLANAYSQLQWYTNSTCAQAMIIGSEMNFSFTGTSLSVWMTNNWWNSGTIIEFPLVAYSIDDGPQTTVQTTVDQSNLFIVSGLSNTTHTCKIVYLSSNYGTGRSRWTPALTSPVLIAPNASLFLGGSFDSFIIDSGATISSSLPYSNHMLVLGDSIAEDDYSNTTIAGSYGDPRTDWSYHIGDALGLNTIRLTYAGTGYYYASGSTSATSTTDGVPAVGTYWPSLFSGTARPYTSIASNVTVILCCHGVNDLNGNQTNVQTAAQNLYSALLSAFPNAIILVYIPFGQAIASTISAAVSSTASTKVKLRNLGSTYATGLGNLGSATYQSLDGTHPNTMTHCLLKAAMIADIKAALAPAKVSTF